MAIEHSDDGPEAFVDATAEQARRVLDAEDGWSTYHAGVAFQSLALTALSESPEGEFLAEVPSAIYRIWAALTDEMDAPRRGSTEQDAAAVRHMKQAASEWLSVAASPEDRGIYLDRWVYEECGYERNPPDGA